MQDFIQALGRLTAITGIPITLVDGAGHIIWPEERGDYTLLPSCFLVIEDFRLQKCGRLRPLINFLEPGLFLGVVEADADHYVLIGHVSPYALTRAEVLKIAGEAIHPVHLQDFCDRFLKQPPVFLEKMKDVICLIAALSGTAVSPEEILFVDNVGGKKLGASLLERTIFEQREESEVHVPIDFEAAVCGAVEKGDRTLLERSLFAFYRGRVGRMSQNDLRQQKYAFICMATLASRAAIRGGLPSETAFSLSDLYCQRADVLTEIPLIQNLTFTMLADYCDKVREIRRRPSVSPVIEKCLEYIFAHLHEPVGLELLSRHCGLCTRSLSLRFKAEVGMGITEYIHREKLREAEYLLRHTDYSLSEISFYLKYPSQSYFTQIFKKYKGQTPQQYRDRQK